MTVAVLLNLPDDVYLALAKTAGKHDTQVHKLLEHNVIRTVRQPKQKATRTRFPAEVLEAIRHMNAAGLSDAAIGKKLGIAQSSVSRHRGRMGLEPPKPRIGGRQRKEVS